MQRKILCSLVVLAIGAGVLAAAEGNQNILLDKSYPAMVLKVDDGKHTLVIQCKSPDGKLTEKPLFFPGTVKLSDIKPGTRYTFFEKGGKVIAVQPIDVAAKAKKPASGTGIAATVPKPATRPAQRVAIVTTPTLLPKTTPLAMAVTEARKAEQAKLAAIASLKTKTAAYHGATAKFNSAQKDGVEADRAELTAKTMLKANESAASMVEMRVLRASLAANRAEAVANLAEAKVVLAQAEAFRSKAAAKVATSQMALAKVDAADLAQAKTFAVRFKNVSTAAANAAHSLCQQAEAAMTKALQEQRTAQQIEKQKTTAFEIAQAHVNQIRKDMDKAQHARADAKKVKEAVHQ